MVGWETPVVGWETEVWGGMETPYTMWKSAQGSAPGRAAERGAAGVTATGGRFRVSSPDPTGGPIMRLASLLLSPLLAAALVAPAPGQQQARVEALSWMAGTWCMEPEGGGRQEEIWTEPAGGLLLGLHRDVDASGQGSFEYLRVEEDAEGLTYWASPSGAPPTPFRLTGMAGQLAVFENPEHDFPRKIVYWRAEHVLKARIEGTEGKDTRAREFYWVAGPCDGKPDLPDDAG